jgi:hypothetical protein
LDILDLFNCFSYKICHKFKILYSQLRSIYYGLKCFHLWEINWDYPRPSSLPFILLYPPRPSHSIHGCPYPALLARMGMVSKKSICNLMFCHKINAFRTIVQSLNKQSTSFLSFPCRFLFPRFTESLPPSPSFLYG